MHADITGVSRKKSIYASESSPTPDEIRAQLDRMLKFAELENSPRLRAFLQYVVEETLAGRANRIKGFAIGQAVYGGDENFDPQNNTIVRVEAGRLRRRLAEYYLTVGQNDPILIDIPKGTYVPTFKWQDTTELVVSDSLEQESTSGTRSRLRNRYTIYILATIILATTVSLVAWLATGNNQLLESEPSHPATATSSTPFIAVLPLETLSGDQIESRLAAGLTEAIITNLTKLSGLSVMAHASMLTLEAQSTNTASIRNKFGATHILRGNLEKDGHSIRVNVQLIDTATGTNIWADRLNGTTKDLLSLQDKLALHIAKTLSILIEPEEQKRFLHRHTNSADALTLYRQALILLMPPNDSERILAARQMFQRVIELDPEFAGGYAGKSFSHTVSVHFLKTTEPDKELSIAKALAEQAIEKDPEFAMGYATLSAAYANSGQLEQALEYANRAIAVQPGDAFAQFILGLNLTMLGKSNEAIAPLKEALRLDPAEPRTPYLNVLGIAHYINGNYLNAVESFERNLNRNGPSGPHMEVFRAAAYAELGEEQKAKAIINEINQAYPNYSAEKWLAKWHKSEAALTRTMNHLYRLGLPRNEQHNH